MNWKFVKCHSLCLAFVGLFSFLYLATNNHYKDSLPKERFQQQIDLTVISSLENNVAPYEEGKIYCFFTY